MTESAEQKALREKPDETIAEWLDKANAVLTTYHDLIRKPGYDAASVAKLLAAEQALRLRAALAELKRLRQPAVHPWGRHCRSVARFVLAADAALAAAEEIVDYLSSGIGHSSHLNKLVNKFRDAIRLTAEARGQIS